METKWQERPLRFTQHAFLRLRSPRYVFKTPCQVKNSSTFNHGVLLINQRTRETHSVFLSAPPRTTIYRQQTSQSYAAESLQLLGGHRVVSTRTWFRYPSRSVFPTRRRAPWTAPNGSRVQKLVGLQHRLSGLSLNCIFSESPRTPQCSHSSSCARSLSLYLSCPPWLNEWAQLKATGDALCVRACARTARRASAHLSPLINRSCLRKADT